MKGTERIDVQQIISELHMREEYHIADMVAEIFDYCQWQIEALREENEELNEKLKAENKKLKRHRVFIPKPIDFSGDGLLFAPEGPKQLYNGEEVEKIVKERDELKIELRDKVDYIHEQYEVIKDYKHRAEVAERALKNFAKNITCEDCPFFSDCASSEKMEDLIHSNYCFAEYLKQAEKELLEVKE